MKPDMTLVGQYARKYGIKSEIRLSEKPDKKLKVYVGGRWIHFGASAYEDFTTHRDTKRQANYCRRAGAIKDKLGRLTGNDPGSPNYYAMRLLWDCTPRT